MNHKIVLTILVISLPIIVIIASANSVIFNNSTYTKTGEIENKEKTINNILNYFQNDQEFLSPQEFNQREITHMADVKKVIQNMNSFLLFYTSLSIILLLYTSTKLSNKNFKKFLSDYLRIGSIITLITITTLSFLALNFDFAFNLFHSLLFQQGTWLFPKSSVLIQLFPIAFFQQISLNIFSKILLAGFVLVLIGFSLKKSK